MKMSAIIAESKMDNISFKNLEEILKKMNDMIQQNKSYPAYILSLVEDKNNSFNLDKETIIDNEDYCENDYEDEDTYHNICDEDYYEEEYDDKFDDNERCKCGEYYYNCICKEIKDMYDRELDDYFKSKYSYGYNAEYYSD
jgi:coenzyme F420-reducing hydrogenase alpha subunit